MEGITTKSKEKREKNKEKEKEKSIALRSNRLSSNNNILKSRGESNSGSVWTKADLIN